jgi:hypothetical protein
MLMRSAFKFKQICPWNAQPPVAAVWGCHGCKQRLKGAVNDRIGIEPENEYIREQLCDDLFNQ